jgi:hypothetical protein
MSIPDDQPLLAMSDAILDGDALAALFRDYRACATALRIQLKSGPGFVLPHSAPSLDEAESLLITGNLRGVQLHYRFKDQNWCDTLMPVAAGVRLVRISL